MPSVVTTAWVSRDLAFVYNQRVLAPKTDIGAVNRATRYVCPEVTDRDHVSGRCPEMLTQGPGLLENTRELAAADRAAIAGTKCAFRSAARRRLPGPARRAGVRARFETLNPRST